MDLKQLQDTWNRLGKDNALWAVLTASNQWEPEAFFETGHQEIAELMIHLNHLSLNLNRDRAQDFGCGVGRLSQALAIYFDEVHGVDIAPSMIQTANEHNRHGAKCRYHQNPDNDLRLFPDSYFDVIYSSIVLQHMAPAYTMGYLAEFLRTLESDGMLVFQLSSRLIAKNPLKRFLLSLFLDRLWAIYRSVKRTLLDWLRCSPQMQITVINGNSTSAGQPSHSKRST